MRVLIHLTFLFIFLNFSALAYEIKVFEFNQEELNSLEVRKVRGADAKTKYSIGKNDKGNFLKAVANNAASGLGKQIKINLNILFSIRYSSCDFSHQNINQILRIRS